MAENADRPAESKSSCENQSNNLWHMTQKVYAECFKGTDKQVLVPMANVNPVRPEQPLKANDPSVELYMQTKDAVPLIVASNAMKNVDDLLSNDHNRIPRVDPKRESGVYVDHDGLLLTSHHLIKDGRDKLAVLDDNMVRHNARVVKEDVANDLTLIQVDKTSPDETFAVLPLGSSSNLLPGAEILSVGHAVGQLPSFLEKGKFVGPVIEKNIPYLNKQATSPGTDAERQMLEMDATIVPGNSGGAWAVLDAQGKAEAVGINDFSNLQSGKAYAVRVERAKALIDEYHREKQQGSP